MKVLFLTNIPSPYRVDFFNELGKYCELTVLYERKKADNREWISNKNINFKNLRKKNLFLVVMAVLLEKMSRK